MFWLYPKSSNIYTIKITIWRLGQPEKNEFDDLLVKIQGSDLFLEKQGLSDSLE